MKNKKNRLIASSATAALVAAAVVPVASASFTDSIPTYAKAAVEFLNENGIMNGLGGTSEFGATNNITRAEVATIIARSLKLETEGKKANFSDVPANHWASGAIAAVVEAGIAQGTGKGFNPDGIITRQEAAVMIANAYSELELNEKAEVSFNDDSNIASWAKKQVEVLASLGIIGGKGNGVFDPISNITRAEFAVLVHRTEVEEVRLEVTDSKPTLTSATIKKIKDQDGKKSLDLNEYVTLGLTGPGNYEDVVFSFNGNDVFADIDGEGPLPEIIVGHIYVTGTEYVTVKDSKLEFSFSSKPVDATPELTITDLNGKVLAGITFVLDVEDENDGE